MLTVNLISATEFKVYFSITIDDDDYYATSTDIAEFFNLSIDTYNKILINKIIQHDNYEINKSDTSVFYKDIMFELKNIDYKIYIERFKEAFAPQLTLFTLGGVEYGIWCLYLRVYF